MGLARRAVTEVSNVPEQADEAVSEDRPASEKVDDMQDDEVDDEADGEGADEGAVQAADPAADPAADQADDPAANPAEAIDDLGDEIATLAAHLHAATYRLLTMIAEFDRLRGWEPEGNRSCAHWLAFRTGIDLGAAREKVRAARALIKLPQISASMERGELSFAKVRALTRVATPESEGDLLELALCSTAAQLERTVRAWRHMSRLDENELERVRHRSRCFSVFPDEEGMYVVRGRLDPEVGAMLMRAVDAASDALFRAGTSEEIEPKQRRADAVGLLAERALAVGFGRAERSGEAADERRHGRRPDERRHGRRTDERRHERRPGRAQSRRRHRAPKWHSCGALPGGALRRGIDFGERA